jgi:hypothetical protein
MFLAFLFVLFRVMRVDLFFGLEKKRSTNHHETTLRIPQSVPAIEELAGTMMDLERNGESHPSLFSRSLFPLP